MDKTSQKIKALVTKGKEKGYLTYEELNDILPDDTLIQPGKIDETLIMLDELGIDLIEESEVELVMRQIKKVMTNQKMMQKQK